MAESIVEIVARHAGRMPDKLCVADLAGAHTYADIWRQVRQVSQGLAAREVCKGDCVMVECTQDAAFLICGLACELSGAIFVPVEHRASEERVRSILQDTAAKLFLCSTEYEVPITKMTAQELLSECAENFAESLPADFVFPKAEDTAELLYTTGTTGASKGIEVTNRNNIALAENVSYGTEMKEDHR